MSFDAIHSMYHSSFAGIWTLEQKKKNQKNGKRKRPGLDQTTKNGKTAAAANNDSTSSSSTAPTMDFAAAKPTFTHRAITRLIHAGVFHFCITQNVDGLHQRTGLSRDRLAVLHGCAFTEKCESCGTEHLRDTDVGGMSFQKTGRECEVCSGALRDTLLDWEDPLPEEDVARSEEECEKADLVLCLGTSLRIFPANQMPLKAKKFAIVNLQQTPMDDTAAIIVRERTDTVLKDVMEQLGYKSDDENESPEIERLWKLKTGDDAQTEAAR